MENYLLHYDAEGNILGFYLRSIHGDNIPSSTIEIAPEKHSFYVRNAGLYKIDPVTHEDIYIGPTQEELDALKNAPIPPTEEERLKAVEDAITILMGV